MLNEKIGNVSFDTRFWDCECEFNYIKPNVILNCNKCGTEKEDSPPSRENEINKFPLLYSVFDKELGVFDNIGLNSKSYIEAFRAIYENLLSGELGSRGLLFAKRNAGAYVKASNFEIITHIEAFDDKN